MLLKKNEMILKNLTKTLCGIRLVSKASEKKLAELDEGILTIAMMLAAIDGQILPAEFAAFERMARKSRGFRNKSIAEIGADVAFSAGMIMAMAQFGVYTEEQRIASFLYMAKLELPKGFANGSMTDLRRAFVLFVAMGVSDGAMSMLEKKTIMKLAVMFATERSKKTGKYESVLEPPFFITVERLVKDLGVETKRAAAEKALKEIINAKSTQAR